MYINALSQCHSAVCNLFNAVLDFTKPPSRVVVLRVANSDPQRRSHDTAAATLLLVHVRIFLFVYLAPDGWHHVVAGRIAVVDEAVEGH